MRDISRLADLRRGPKECGKLFAEIRAWKPIDHEHEVEAG
jgi:hypothetical protein